MLHNAFAMFVNPCGANMQIENNWTFEVLTGLSTKLSIAIIMTPGSKTKVYFCLGETSSKSRLILIKVYGVTFQNRAVLIGRESLQLGMLLTAKD
jgi:hypothetical protein